MSIAVCLAGFGCVFLIVIFVLINKYSRRNKFGIKGMTRVFFCIILKGSYDAILMNEWCIYTVLYCVLLYTQSTLQSWGLSILNHHQCAASTWMIIISCIWCNRICWHALMFKKHYFSNTVHYCIVHYAPALSNASFSTKPLLLTICSDWPTDSVHCDWPNTTSRVGNVTPLSIITRFSFQSKYKDS